MSVNEDLMAANKELEQATTRMSIVGGVMVAAMSVANIMRCNEANVWRVVTTKRLVKITHAYTASVLATADQLNEELKVINAKRGQDENQS